VTVLKYTDTKWFKEISTSILMTNTLDGYHTDEDIRVTLKVALKEAKYIVDDKEWNNDTDGLDYEVLKKFINKYEK
jgi:hypothetical protein